MNDIERKRCKSIRRLTALALALGMMSFAVPACAAPPATRLRVLTLGTGDGPIPRKLRSQPANLLIVDGVSYLIDMGDGVVRHRMQADVAPAGLRAAFLTHLHLDHSAGMSSVIVFRGMAAMTGRLCRRSSFTARTAPGRWQQQPSATSPGRNICSRRS